MLIYLLMTFVVFLIGGVITYGVINREVDLEQQRFLGERLTSLLKMIESREPTQPVIRDKMSIIPLDQLQEETEVVFSDTIVTHATLDRPEPHVRLDVVKNVNNRSYKISMYDLIIEKDDIAEGVEESLIKIYLILIFSVLIISGLTSYWLLKPFNNTLDRIKEFNLRRKNKLELQSSTTKEFKRLNEFLKEMTDKVQTDYRAMKEFTENAAHEMKTPLSIASGKLEMLLNSEGLSDEQTSLVSSAQNSLQRLSRLNKSLGLLTKIDNKEFEEVKEIDLSQKLNQQLDDFTELIELKSIDLHERISDKAKITMDESLCDIIITNLIQNAIKHNIKKGKIIVELTTKHLSISNTGKPLSISNPEHLFDRFRKDNQSHESLGLGLSIVKKICEVSDLSIDYRYVNDLHSLTLRF